MNLTTSLAFLLALTVANYWFKRSVVYPPFVFTSIWLLVIGVSGLNLSELDELHAITFNVICGGTLLFSIGGALAFLAPVRAISGRIRFLGPPRGSGRLLQWFLISVLFVGVCLQIRFLLDLAASSGGGIRFLAAARQAMIDDANDSSATFRWFTYITTWSVFIALLFQLDRKSKASRVVLGLAFVSCVASTGRGQILLFFSALTTIYLIRKGKEHFTAALRFARWPVLGFLALFVILMFTNKDTSKLSVTPAQYVGDSIIGYLCGSTAALDLVLRHRADYMGVGLPGTLAPVFRLASLLGLLQYTPPPTFEPYVFVPVPINTFTVFKSWILDFGLIPGMLIVGLVGFGHSLLYQFAKTESRLALFLFSLSMFSAVMVFFVDTYSSMSFYAEAFLFGTIYLCVRSIPPQCFYLGNLDHIDLPDKTDG